MRYCYIILILFSLQSNVIFAAPEIHFEVIGERHHNPELFTQGLEVHDDKFYESSGLYNKSHWLIYPVEFPSTKWVQMTRKPDFIFKLHKRYFAEGLTLFKDKIYLLTWNERKVFVFDSKTHEELKPLRFLGEGWGLTHDNEFLIRSDGSHRLFFHHPDTFKVQKTLEVKDNSKKIDQLNELEFAQGFIWANLWYQHKIVKIDPQTGEVLGELNLQSIAATLFDHPEKVLNGIAWDEKRQGFWITGKWWPKMFLIKISSQQTESNSSNPHPIPPNHRQPE
jgi:glutaminyl-peptide cyclotransferase